MIAENAEASIGREIDRVFFIVNIFSCIFDFLFFNNNRKLKTTNQDKIHDRTISAPVMTTGISIGLINFKKFSK